MLTFINITKYRLTLITGYGGTLYIGIAMVFVFSQYIRKFSSYFQFQVISTFYDFTAQNLSKLSCVATIDLQATRKRGYIAQGCRGIETIA